jgi:hypothetical protein
MSSPLDGSMEISDTLRESLLFCIGSSYWFNTERCKTPVDAYAPEKLSYRLLNQLVLNRLY